MKKEYYTVSGMDESGNKDSLYLHKDESGLLCLQVDESVIWLTTKQAKELSTKLNKCVTS